VSAVLFVGLGGAVGAVARYLLVVRVGGRFPWSILIANLAGSFLLGVLVASASPDVLLFAGVGFCGALTTFSTFALDTLVLAREGRRAASAVNVILSVAGCVSALIVGLAIGRALQL
jgi:CrcB protein